MKKPASAGLVCCVGVKNHPEAVSLFVGGRLGALYQLAQPVKTVRVDLRP